jgi:cation diffusion facilitator family transporter
MMHRPEPPEELRPVQRRAVVLERITIVYLLTAIALLALTLGQSQAMKAAWIEDMLSLLPPIAFLVAARIRNRPPNEKFPWGYHRSVSIAYAFAALALLALGGYVFFDSAMKLVKAEHPPIGVIQLFGEEVWLGWVMLGALAYTGIPPVILGRMKLRLAAELHDKVLYADAEMNRADWMTAGAAMLGVIGIGLGLWWADAVAALFISVDIVRDGWRNIRTAVHDLMDAMPRTYDASDWHRLIADIEAETERCDWVEDATVRLREAGHVFTGEVHVVPAGGDPSLEQLAELAERVHALDWKLYDIAIVPVAGVSSAPAAGAGRIRSPGRPDTS